MDPVFDHEKLEVYQLELSFLTWSTELLKELRSMNSTMFTEIRTQMERSSLSSLLNTAEGNGKRYKRLRAKFFDDARGSAMESASCLDALVAIGATTRDAIGPGKQMLIRIVQMLTKLVQMYEADSVREEPTEYRVDSEFRYGDDV